MTPSPTASFCQQVQVRLDGIWNNLPDSRQHLWAQQAGYTAKRQRSGLDWFRHVNIYRLLVGMTPLEWPPDRTRSLKQRLSRGPHMPDLPIGNVYPVWVAGWNKDDDDGGTFDPLPEPDPDPLPIHPWTPAEICPYPAQPVPPMEDLLYLAVYTLQIVYLGERSDPASPDPESFPLDLDFTAPAWTGAIAWHPPGNVLFPLTLAAALRPVRTYFIITAKVTGTGHELSGCSQTCHFYRCHYDGSVPTGLYTQLPIASTCARRAYAILTAPVTICRGFVINPLETYTIRFQCRPGFDDVPGCPAGLIHVFRHYTPHQTSHAPTWQWPDATWSEEEDGRWGLFCYAQSWYIQLTIWDQQQLYRGPNNIYQRPTLGRYQFFRQFPPEPGDLPWPLESITLEPYFP